MQREALYKIGGVCLAAAALVIAATTALELFVSPYNPYGSARALDAPVHVARFVAVVLFLFGLPWFYLRQSERAGIVGLLGFIGLFVGLPLTTMPYMVIEISLDPALSQEAAARAFRAVMGPPPGGNVYLGVMGFAGFLHFMLGLILTAIATWRARVLPRWAPVASLAGLVVGQASGFLQAAFPGLVPHGPTYIMLGMSAYGFALLARAREASAVQAREATVGRIAGAPPSPA